MDERTQATKRGAGTGGAPASPVAVASIIISLTLVAIGNGLMFAYIPVRLGQAGFDPTWAGTMLTGLAAGSIAACLLTGRLVRRVGHARAIMVFSALIVLSNAAVGAGTMPVPWIAARALYGFGITGIFIVAQAWLNDAVENRVRGRVMAIMYVAYVVGLGVGSFGLRFLDLGTAAVPLLGIAFTAVSILPIGLTRLRPPPPPASASVRLAQAWRISPVGLAGMMAAGGLGMMVGGFAPIHVTAIGFTQEQVATLMFVMPIGTLLLQIPLGWVSDRIDRRRVLIGAALLVAAAGVAATHIDGSALVVVILVYAIWSGAGESIYSLANAHAADRADKDELVAMSSSMMFAWSIAGFIAPAIGTVLTAFYGTSAFMYVAIAVALLFAGFTAWRILVSAPTPSGDVVAFTPHSAQLPLPVDPEPEASHRLS